MKPKDELARDIQQGERARQLLKDPMIADALSSMREAVYHNIRTSHYSKVDEREDLYKMLRAIDAFEEQFRLKIRGGEKAKSLLEKFFNR